MILSTLLEHFQYSKEGIDDDFDQRSSSSHSYICSTEYESLTKDEILKQIKASLFKKAFKGGDIIYLTLRNIYIIIIIDCMYK